jgi:hypothetical protein
MTDNSYYLSTEDLIIIILIIVVGDQITRLPVMTTYKIIAADKAVAIMKNN